ncbi:MAG TPA: phage holin family protein [Candidatus Baltobacteraceae bacterium]|nr:phage holin family protein [Candidatus Baltobacteraceae bacterium]
MHLLLRWLLNALALMLVTRVVPGVTVDGLYSALIVALVLGIVNALIRPILIFLTLPINILTLGLFTFVINALLFWFVSTFVKGFQVSGFAAAFWGALVLWAVSWITNALLTKDY